MVFSRGMANSLFSILFIVNRALMILIPIRNEHRHNLSLLRILHGLGVAFTFREYFLNTLGHPDVEDAGETANEFALKLGVDLNVLNRDRTLNDFTMG